MNPLETLLNRTRAAADARRKNSADEYAQLVDEAARGEKELDPDLVVQYLDDHRIDAADFQRDVIRRAARLNAAAAIAACPQAERRRANAEAKLASLKNALDSRVEAERVKFEATVAKLRDDNAITSEPHINELQAAEKAIANAVEAKNTLLETGTPEQLADRKRLQDSIPEINRQIGELRQAAKVEVVEWKQSRIAKELAAAEAQLRETQESLAKLEEELMRT